MSRKNYIMKITKYISLPLLALGIIMTTGSCKKEEVEPTPTPTLMSKTYDYEFNNGQIISTSAYTGAHYDNLTASMQVDETATGANITLTLMNTIDGETYHVHAHDAADPATTPNGTPYNESPNTGVFTQMVVGNGGTVTLTQSTTTSYSDLNNVYNGFLVVHDPLQAVTTLDVTTYVILGTFARTQATNNFGFMEFPYAFNTGQVDASYAYSGTHANTLNGKLRIQELGDGNTRVSVMLDNTMNGETYHVHSHDAADPATTPNNTPYDETPNQGLCTVMLNGNGSSVNANQISALSYSNITTVYNGFFVAHDPLQAVNTADPSTYVLLGAFAR